MAALAISRSSVSRRIYTRTASDFQFPCAFMCLSSTPESDLAASAAPDPMWSDISRVSSYRICALTILGAGDDFYQLESLYLATLSLSTLTIDCTYWSMSTHSLNGCIPPKLIDAPTCAMEEQEPNWPHDLARSRILPLLAMEACRLSEEERARPAHPVTSHWSLADAIDESDAQEFEFAAALMTFGSEFIPVIELYTSRLRSNLQHLRFVNGVLSPDDVSDDAFPLLSTLEIACDDLDLAQAICNLLRALTPEKLPSLRLVRTTGNFLHVLVLQSNGATWMASSNISSNSLASYGRCTSEMIPLQHDYSPGTEIGMHSSRHTKKDVGAARQFEAE
jgi:hypothetical protein